MFLFCAVRLVLQARSCPESPKRLHVDDSCFWIPPFATLRVKYLMEFDREHSAPAKDDILSAQDVENLDQHQ